MSEPLTGEEKAEFLRRSRESRQRREEQLSTPALEPLAVEEEEEEEEEEKPPGLTQEEEEEYEEARRDVIASAQARAPAPIVISDTARALDTKKREAAMPELDRQVAQWRRHANADVKWSEEMGVLADALDEPLEAFGTSHIPGNAVYKAIRTAQANPDDEVLRHNMMYLTNDLNITNQYPLTEKNYEEKLSQLALKDGIDLLRIDTELKGTEDAGLVGAPQSGMTLYVRQPGRNFTEKRYQNALREFAAQAEAIETKKEFKRVAKDYAYLLEAPELLLKYANNDVEKVKRALKHGEMAAASGLDSASYTPMQDRYGPSVDTDTMRLVAYVRTHRQITEETGEEPDPTEVIAQLGPALAAFEEELISAGLPVYDPDPMKTTEKLLRFARAGELAAEEGAPEGSPMMARYFAPGAQTTREFVASLGAGEEVARTAGQAVGLGPKLISAIGQQLVFAEAKSGYVTLNDEQIRVAQDRFVESLIGRNAASSTADYILTLASGEFIAKPYVLMVSALQQKYPDEPMDGILARHPVDAKNLFYKYLGSEETVLDRAVTDSQMAEMLMTSGRAVVPSYEYAQAVTSGSRFVRGLLGQETTLEDDPAYHGIRFATQGLATVGGAGGILLAMARDPTDAINVISKGTATLGRAVAGSKVVQRLQTASRASGDAMEVSVLDGIPAAAEDMAQDEAFQEVFAGVTRETPAKEVIRRASDPKGPKVIIDGEEVSVLAALLDKAKENEVAHGLGAAHLAAQEEAIEAVLGARVNNTVPPYGVAEAAAQIQRNAETKITEALESTQKALDEVDFDLPRRQAYDKAAKEHAAAAYGVGQERRYLDVLNDRIRSLKTQGMAAVRVTNQSKVFVADRGRARETLLAALGRFEKAGEAAGKDAYTKLSILLAADPALEGKTTLDVVRDLKAGTKEQADFADNVLDKFFEAYGAAGDKAGDALKGAALRRLEQDIARLKDARTSVAARFDASNARLTQARKALDEAIESVEEIAPTRAERQAATATKQGRLGPQRIEADDGTVTYRPRDPVPKKVKKASGEEVLRKRKSLREKLVANADAIESTTEAPQKAQEAALKALERKAKRLPNKKQAKKLEEQKKALEEEKARETEIGAAVAQSVRDVEAEFASRLLGLADVLEARRALKGGLSDKFVDVGKVLDDYERGVYAGQSLADVLRSARTSGTPRIQAQLDVLWENIGNNPALLDATDTDEAFTSLQTYMNANRLWFDPYSAVGRQKLPFEQSLDLLTDSNFREVVQVTTGLLEGTYNLLSDRYGRARALRNLQQAVAPLMPTSIPRAVKAIHEKQKRRESIIEADVIAIEKAVEAFTTKVGVTAEEGADIAIKARRAYVTRDWDALVGDKEGFEVLKDIFEVVGKAQPEESEPKASPSKGASSFGK